MVSNNPYIERDCYSALKAFTHIWWKFSWFIVFKLWWFNQEIKLTVLIAV